MLPASVANMIKFIKIGAGNLGERWTFRQTETESDNSNDEMNYDFPCILLCKYTSKFVKWKSSWRMTKSDAKAKISYEGIL